MTILPLAVDLLFVLVVGLCGRLCVWIGIRL